MLVRSLTVQIFKILSTILLLLEAVEFAMENIGWLKTIAPAILPIGLLFCEGNSSLSEGPNMLGKRVPIGVEEVYRSFDLIGFRASQNIFYKDDFR